jgi:chemotaxis protein CheX
VRHEEFVVPVKTDLIDDLVMATEEVFETMVFKKLTTGAPIAGDALRSRSNVVGLVGFGGTISGLVALYSTRQTAEEIAGSMLGLPANEVDGEMPDAIGEVTNMIAGLFRLRLAERGEVLAISIPSVTIGSDFYTKYSSDVRRVMCPFKMDDKEICVELILMRN